MTRPTKENFFRPAALALILLVAIGLVSLSFAGPGRAAPAAQSAATTTPQQVGIIEYVVDLSASMVRKLPDGDRIWDKTLASVFTYEDYLLGSNLALGLRTFGYPDLSCGQQILPSSPVVAPRLGAGPQIVEALGEIVPNPSAGVGRSAIFTAISKALEDIGSIGAAAGENRSIIVFTDGKENCMIDLAERQEWVAAYLEQIKLLASGGIRVKTYILIIVPEDENICNLLTGYEASIVCIPVSAVEASNLPGIVEAIRVETILEPTPTPGPTVIPTKTETPSPTPTPTDYAFYDVPTGEALSTLDRTLVAQAATPAVIPQSNSSKLDPKIFIVPIGLVLLIGISFLVIFGLNLSGGGRRR
jgi:hypothetical protein